MNRFRFPIYPRIGNFFFLAALIGVSLSCFANSSDRYTFSSWGLPSAGWGSKFSIEFVFLDEMVYQRSGSEVSQVELCNDDPDFQCLVAHGFSFSVPRRGIEQEQTWEHNGVIYAVTSELELLILGNSILVDQIETEESDIPDIFYYSESLGLIGFAYSKKGEVGISAAPELYFVEKLPGPLSNP